MKDLLNKGFQPVSETEMVMVEGGRLTPPCVEHGQAPDDAGQFSVGRKNLGYVDQFIDECNSKLEDQYTKIVSGIMQAQKMSGCGSGCYASCCVNSLNDYF